MSNVPEEVREAMARAYADKRTPYASRRNKSYDDGRIYEVIRLDNPDWRDVITDDQTVMGRFPNSQEADALCAKLEAEFRIDAALSALEAAGWELNRKGTLEALEAAARPLIQRLDDLEVEAGGAIPRLLQTAHVYIADLRGLRAAMLTASRKEKPDV